MTKLSIVIPTYNEEEAIEDILNRILAAKLELLDSVYRINEIEVIVVNDGSKDKTSEILRRYRDEIIIIENKKNLGYGAALKKGFDAANGEYIGFLDADGTYPPEFFKLLWKRLVETNADLVIGSRFLGEKTRMPFQRKVGNRLFAYILSWIVNRKITDTASGMRIFRKEILYRLYPLPDGLHLTPAMSAAALHEQLNIAEVPIPYEERTGSSKLNAITDGIRFLRIIINTSRIYNPLKFLGILGIFMIVLGLLLSINPISYYFQFRRVEDYQIYRLFTIMVLFVTGLNTITFGAFANYVLSMLHNREVNQNGFIGKYILSRIVLKKFNLIGWVLAALALIINYKTIIEFIMTGHIYIHWSYIITGATFFLVGVQLIMCSYLIQILDELKEKMNLY